jgi:hypothetical protein
VHDTVYILPSGLRGMLSRRGPIHLGVVRRAIQILALRAF